LFHSWNRDAILIGLAAVIVACTGLIDDLKNLNPAPRLAIEVVAALLAVYGGARAQIFHNGLDVVLTVLWLVVITNSFNLLDNMDGIAATIATVTSGALLIAAALNSQWLIAALASSLAGACIGFLVYNWHPASIFMGDAGSLFLGFLLAVCALKLRWKTGFDHSVPAVLLLMFPAVFDTSLVIFNRKRAGRPIMLGGTDHTTHRLHRLGIPIKFVATLIGLTTVAMSTLGVLVGRGVINAWLVVVPILALSAMLFVRLSAVSVYEAGAGRVSKKTTESKSSESKSSALQ
jgi:UDP-GlcNAc:undecaprenyl-phosphate/decaprenyl-phosphate GlcNAc-1-phosphate transferase